MSVSNATRSPGSITRLLASWNHGLVRWPDVSRQHSIHSPSWAMLVWCRMLHSSFSVMPGCNAWRMRSTPTSHTSIDSCMAMISSGDLIMRASSSGSCASNSWMPASVRCLAPHGSQRSTASRWSAPPYCRMRSMMSRDHSSAFSCVRGPGQEVEPRHGLAHLVDRVEVGLLVHAGSVLEQHDRAVDGHEHVATRSMQRPHVEGVGVGGVADVDRVAQQRRAVVVGDQLGAYPSQPVEAQLAPIDRVEACRHVDGQAHEIAPVVDVSTTDQASKLCVRSMNSSNAASTASSIGGAS